jgi:hypothetical protein
MTEELAIDTHALSLLTVCRATVDRHGQTLSDEHAQTTALSIAIQALMVVDNDSAVAARSTSMDVCLNAVVVIISRVAFQEKWDVVKLTEIVNDKLLHALMGAAESTLNKPIATGGRA